MEQILEKQELKNPRQEIKEHLKTLQKIKQAKVEKCDILRQELEELEKPFDIEFEAVTNEILKIAPEINATLQTEAGIVKRLYRKASSRRSYPVEVLESFLDSKPEIADVIRPLMKKTEIPKSINYTIEVF